MTRLPKKLTALSTDTEVAGASLELFCAVKFHKNRKRNFESVVALCENAAIFLQNNEQYLVGFSKDKAGAELALAVFEEMRIASWNYLLFASGRVHPKKSVYALRNVLDCFCKAVSLRDYTNHCHKTYDDPIERFTSLGPRDETHSWTLPCKALEGFLDYTSERELNDPTILMETIAENRLITSCPLFDLDNFDIVEKPKRVSKAKKYWD